MAESLDEIKKALQFAEESRIRNEREAFEINQAALDSFNQLVHEVIEDLETNGNLDQISIFDRFPITIKAGRGLTYGKMKVSKVRSIPGVIPFAYGWQIMVPYAQGDHGPIEQALLFDESGNWYRPVGHENLYKAIYGGSRSGDFMGRITIASLETQARAEIDKLAPPFRSFSVAERIQLSTIQGTSPYVRAVFMPVDGTSRYGSTGVALDEMKSALARLTMR